MKPHILALILALSANAAANLLIRAGMRDKPLDLADPAGALRQILLNPLVAGGIALFAVNVVSYAYVLSRVPVSLAYPVMTSAGFLIVVSASALWLGESLDLVQGLGLLLIVAGVVLVAGRMG
jgi:multidrug transporter EmrE-like cation transporter